MSKTTGSGGAGNPRPFRTPRILQNWIGLAGGVLAASAIFAFIFLFAIDIFARQSNPYMGILAYVVAPAFFFMGVGLIALGYILQRRHRKKTRGEPIPLVLSINLTNKRHRRILGVFVFGAIGFLLLTAFGSYQSYHVTETVGFCGEACHVPMEPQFVTYQHSHHASVQCAECHVGPGATAYLKTKVNGVKQLYHATLGDFQRPIRLTERDKRPTEETCGNCHWRERFIGNLEKTRHHFLADETNTPFSVRLLVNVGGGDPVTGPVTGSHWHTNLANKVEFITTDESESQIPWIRLTEADGKTTVFKTPEFTGNPTDHPILTMDCMDCHNRPAHRFDSPNDAVDLALLSKRIDPTIPWVKKNAVDALSRIYPDRSNAKQEIETYLTSQYPDDPRTPALVSQVQSIYQLNFFPEMKADWRAYPDQAGHKDSAGCFRCHDGNHVAETDGRPLKGSECSSCHVILAQGNGEEFQKLDSKGLDFIHVDFEYSDFDCFNCHTGTNQVEEE